MTTSPPPALTSPARRYGQLLVGLVLYAASIALIVHPALGSMPWEVLSQGLTHRLGWSLGTATIVVSLAVLVCWVPLRQRPGVGTIANVLVIGLLVDPFLAVLRMLPELGLGWRVAMAGLGIVVNGLATASYVGARLGPGPRDGLMTGLVARTGRSVRLVRTSIEASVVLVGWVLGGTLGLGTLAYALAIGPLVHVLLPVLSLDERAPRTATAPPAPARGPDDAVGAQAQTGR